MTNQRRTLLAVGRVLVENDSDLSTAHALAKQIHIVPRTNWRLNQQRSGATTTVEDACGSR